MAYRAWISTATTDYNNTAGWTAGDTPDAGDDVALEFSNIDINANLDQSAVALATFNQWADYTGRVGVWPGYASLGTYLQIASAIVNLGKVRGPSKEYAGSQRMMIDVGAATACVLTVESTSKFSADDGFAPVRLKGNKNDHVLRVWEGIVDVCNARSDEAGEFATVTIGRPGGKDQSALVAFGPLLVISTLLELNAGILKAHGVLTSANLYGGQLHHTGAGTVSGTVTVKPGAKYFWSGTGTANAITVLKGGFLDFSNGRGTISTLTYDDPNDLRESNAVTVTTRNPTTRGH